MVSKTIFLILIMSILFVSGCIDNDVDVTKLVKQTQQGQDFLSNYPRAEITAVSLSNETIASMIDEIRIDCHQTIPVKAYWNVKLTDPDTNTKLKMWIDKETQEVVCIIKKANTNKTEPNNQTQEIPENNDNPIPEIRKNCRELNGFLCDESNDCAVDWLDSSDSYCCPIECNTCPSDCDDENPCTKDECNKETNYECTYEEIGRCLSNGNGICETGELVPDILTSPDCNICGTWNNNVDCTPFLTSSTTAETISDCPLNCADSDEKTLDWYDFETQQCKHKFCEEEKSCPDTCNDNNLCTEDYCSESTGYECVNDIISPCCGNDICENTETFSSCSDDCENPCPDNCDDNNICTTDYCSASTNYVCTHDQIIPCCGNNLCEGGESMDYCATDCKGYENDLKNLGYNVTYIERNEGQYWNGGSIWNYIMTVIQKDNTIQEEGNINLNLGYELSKVVDPLASIYYPDAEISVTLLYTTCGGRYITCANTISGDSNMGGCSENFNLPPDFCQ